MTDNERSRIHDDGCGCGHNHDGHRYEHGESCGCGVNGHDTPGTVRVECRLHDEARVVSGRLTLTCPYEPVKKAVAEQLERIAGAVREMSGIVGHIKASCRVKTVDMFSVTDSDASVKTAPEQEIEINMAAIVFLIDPAQAEDLVRRALEAIRQTAGI